MLQPHCTSGRGRELEARRGCHVLDISPWQMGQFIGSFLLRFVARGQLAPIRRAFGCFRPILCGPLYQSGNCLLLTGRMVALDARLLSSLMPSTFLACCFAFSSVRNRFGWRGVLLPVRNSTR